MSRDSITDYLACILFKASSFLARCLPVEAGLFLGRRLGDIFYYCDFKHCSRAFSHIHAAFSRRKSFQELNCITRQFYRNYGQNLMEMFYIPVIDKKYIDKYIRIEGGHNIDEAFKKGKGVIFLGLHEGSWELSNIISAKFGLPFVLFVRNQKFPRLNALLNSYRQVKGCRIIQRQVGIEDKENSSMRNLSGMRQLFETLKNNEAIGMNFDQGGKSGLGVDFFGREASVPTAALRIALKNDVSLVPIYYRRIKGARHEVLIEPVFKIQKTGDLQKDLRVNAQELTKVFEKHVAKYPAEYLWQYKIWKYANKKRVLVISDGKAGHLRQAEGAAQAIKDYFNSKGEEISLNICEISFEKSNFNRFIFSLCVNLSTRGMYQLMHWCLKEFLKKEQYDLLMRESADIVISSGAAVSCINYAVSCLYQAKSVLIMRPSFIKASKFDLLIIPKHDLPRKRKNTVITQGSLNLISEDYLLRNLKDLSRECSLSKDPGRLRIGVLIGGESKGFHYSREIVQRLIQQLKDFAQSHNAYLLITTSRRTPPETERAFEEALKGFEKCELLVIANKKNFPFTVGGILGLSQLVVVSPESISMISEAASSGKYIVVFKADSLGRRHNIFLKELADKKYIYLSEPEEISATAQKIIKERPAVKTLQDKFIVTEAVKKIL